MLSLPSIDKINIITHSEISPLYTNHKSNKIFIESYGMMYYNYIIIREIVYKNDSFLAKLITTIEKIVHPNIQICYGITHDTKTNSQCIILEYITALNLDEIYYLKYLLSSKEEIVLKLKIISLIAQTLSFLYNSACPYLVLNSHSVKLNYKLLTDKHQHLKIIYCDNSYIETNLIKFTQIGLYLKYGDSEVYNIYDDSVYNISYFSPGLIEFLVRTNTDRHLPCIDVLQQWDVWSFGCLVYEVFTGCKPYYEYYGNKERLMEVIVQKEKYNQHWNVENCDELYKEVCMKVNENVVNRCVDGSLKDFNEVIGIVNGIITEMKKEMFDEKEVNDIKSKVSGLDFKSYHLPKFQELHLFDQEVNKSKELLTKIEDVQRKINSFPRS